jgi:hypothetical protein
MDVLRIAFDKIDEVCIELFRVLYVADVARLRNDMKHRVRYRLVHGLRLGL